MYYSMYAGSFKRTLSTNEFLNSKPYQNYEETKEELEQFQEHLEMKNRITFYQYFDVGAAVFLAIIIALYLVIGNSKKVFQIIAELLKIVSAKMQLSIFIGLGTLFAAYIFYVTASAFRMPTKISRGAYINSSRIILTFIIYIVFLVLQLSSPFAEASFLLTLFIVPILFISFTRAMQFILGYGRPTSWERAYCTRSIVPGIIYAEAIQKQGRALEHLLRCFIEQKKLNITILDKRNRDRFAPLFESEISFGKYIHNIDFTQFMHAVDPLSKAEQGAIALEKNIFDNEGIAGYMIYIKKETQEINKECSEDKECLKEFRKRLFKRQIIKLRRKAFKKKKLSKILSSGEAHTMLVEYACYACTSMDQRRMRVVREIYNLLLDKFSELQTIKNIGDSNRFLDALKASIAAIIDYAARLAKKAHAEGLTQKTKDLNSFIDYLRNIKNKLANP